MYSDSIFLKTAVKIAILHNLGDKLFSRTAAALDLSLKNVRSQQDKLILHQKCVSAMISRTEE